MAWKYEAKTGDIVIDGFDKGIGTSPYDGMQNVYGSTSVPGEISAGYTLTTATTSGATLGKPMSRATYMYQGSAVAYLVLDDTGNVFVSTTLNGTYSSTSATVTGAASTDSIIAWKGYVLRFGRSGKIDYATINSGGTVGAWTDAWQTFTGGGLPNFSFVGRDDVVYWCNGQYLGSIQEKAGQTFNPADTATFTFNQQALALPISDISTCIEEQGLNLLIGSSQDVVYVWDRISPTFNNRIYLADRYVYRMVKSNTNVYIFCGHRTTGGRGRIYVTNGSQADLFLKFPDFLTNRQDPIFIWGDAIYHRNMLIFSLYAQTNNTSPTVLLTIGGVFAINLETKALTQISGLGGAEVASILIPDTSGSASGQAGMGYIAGVYNASTGASHSIQYSTTAAGTGSASISTELIPVGNYLRKNTKKSIEYKLRSPLASGESISITQVDEQSNSSVLINDNTVGHMSAVSNIALQGIQWMYLQIALVGNSAASGVRLKEIRIHP